MRGQNFLRTPIRGDHQNRLQLLSIGETSLSGNPRPGDPYPQTLTINFDVAQDVTEIQIAPLWEGFLTFLPDSSIGNPLDPSEVTESDSSKWSLIGDVVLRSYFNFASGSDFESIFEQNIPLISPVPNSVRYSKIEITRDFLFTTMRDAPKYAEFFNEELVTATDPLYFEKFVISFLKGKAEVPCLIDPVDPTLDTAMKPMPAIHLSPPGTSTILSVTISSSTEKITDPSWFDQHPEFDDISGEILVDPAFQTLAHAMYDPSHPGHSVISALAMFGSALPVAFAIGHDISQPLTESLIDPRVDNLTYRHVEVIRPILPGSPVSSNPQRPNPMYSLNWKLTSGGATDSLRIPLSGSLYLPLANGDYTFWAIPRSQDPAVVLEGSQLRLSQMLLPPSKYIGLPESTVTVNLTGLQSARIYSHFLEFDSLFVWEEFRRTVADGTRNRLEAKARSDWNTDVFHWHIVPTDTDEKKSFALLYGFIRESAARHGLAPEFLLTVFMGEGGNLAIKDRATFDPFEVLDAFNFLGLDLILYRTGGLMPDGTAPPLPSIPAGNTDELAEYTYNLVTEGYVDALTAAAVSWTGEAMNEIGRLLQVAKIDGWGAAIELIAAELHSRLDEMIAYLSTKSPQVQVITENQRRFLSYIRFNSKPETARRHADHMNTEIAKWLGPSSGSNLNALFNTLQRIAVAQWHEDARVYR